MTEKQKVSREVAEAIEFLKKEFDYNFEAFMKVSLNDGWHINKNCISLNKISVEDLAKILINGYEVELTPEEKVLEYFNDIKQHVEYSESKGEKNKAGEDALNIIRDITTILGYVIKGVNA